MKTITTTVRSGNATLSRNVLVDPTTPNNNNVVVSSTTTTSASMMSMPPLLLSPSQVVTVKGIADEMMDDDRLDRLFVCLFCACAVSSI